MVRPRPAALPVLEQTLYWVFGLASTAYSIYNVYVYSMEFRMSQEFYFRGEGWPSLGGVKDSGEYEWQFYSSRLIWLMLPWMVLHIAVSASIRMLCITGTTKKILLICVGAAASFQMVSVRYLCFTAMTPVVFLAVSTLRTASAVWVFAVAGMFLLSSNEYHNMSGVVNVQSEEEHFIVVYQWSSVLLRSIGFGLERVWSKNQQDFEKKSGQNSSKPSSSKRASRRKKASIDNVCGRDIRTDDLNTFPGEHSSFAANGKQRDKAETPSSALYGWPVLSEVPGLIDGLVYVFYIPVLFNGPAWSLDKLLAELEFPKDVTSSRLLSVLWCLLRIAFWFVFNEVALHFVYFSSLSESPSALQQMNCWTLFGVAFLLGQSMTNKYVVIFGLPTQLSRLDGLDPPAFPACISYIYKYSDMWKSFDRGLHDVLKRYIYIPCGGSRSGFLRHQVATLLTFSFMGYWHGGRMNHLWWVALNFLGINMEVAGAYLERSTFVQTHLLQKLSPHADARLRGGLGLLVLMVGTTSNMFFIANVPFGIKYGTEMLTLGGPSLLLCVSFYTMVQNARHLERLGYTKY